MLEEASQERTGGQGKRFWRTYLLYCIVAISKFLATERITSEIIEPLCRP
jgi:hypothetical protein